MHYNRYVKSGLREMKYRINVVYAITYFPGLRQVMMSQVIQH